MSKNAEFDALPDAPRAHDSFDELPDAPAHDRSALATFVTHAAGQLAGGLGLDRALAAGETAGETLANLVTDKKGNFKLGGDSTDKEGILDRYHRKVKENAPIAEGMAQDEGEHPIAALAGNMAPAFIPGGAGLKGAMALGGIHGALGGSSDTSGGDLKGTAEDAALGMLGGGVGQALGSAGGKFIGWLGKKAASKFEHGITERVASLLGKYAKKKQEHAGVERLLATQDALENAAVRGLPPTAAKQLLDDLYQKFPQMVGHGAAATRNNARRVFRRQVGSVNRFGQSAMPPIDYAERLALRNMMSQKTSAIKSLLGMGVRVGGGMAVGGAIGSAFDSPGRSSVAYGGALIGGGGGLWVARKLATNVMEHPRMLSLVARRFPPIGKALSATGGGSGKVLGYLTALFASKQGREALKDSVAEFEAMPDVEPLAADGGTEGAQDHALDFAPTQPPTKMKESGETNETDEQRNKRRKDVEESEKQRRKRHFATGGTL